MYQNETKTYVGTISTEYRVCGTAEYVERTVARLERDYPAPGYGTRVTHRGQSADGREVAHVVRDNSCD